MSWLNLTLKSSLLKRQIRKHLRGFEEKDFDKIDKFIYSIDDEYNNTREDRELLERSLDISSNELSRKNEQLVNVLTKNIEINESLEKSQNNLNLILNNLWDWVIVVNFKNEVIMFNSKASLLSGYSSSTIIWKKYDDFIKFTSDDKSVVIEDFILNTLNNEKEYSIDRNVLLVWNNKKTSVFITSTPIKNYSSKWTACVVVFKDATRERELSNMKNEFLSVASHELRTPMTVIKWYVALFLKGILWDLNDKQKLYLEKILNNTKNLIDMVNDMLDVNKLEAGKMEFLYEKFSVKELVEKDISEMLDLLNNKKIKIDSSLEDIFAVSDKKKITQILINFISNAYKFTPENWEIFVKLEKSEDDISFIISVKDSWIWIKEEDISKLFKKFSQVWSHLNKTEKWTWLWLSICKRISESMWWEVFVESVFWKWSTFWIKLPIKND